MTENLSTESAARRNLRDRPAFKAVIFVVRVVVLAALLFALYAIIVGASPINYTHVDFVKPIALGVWVLAASAAFEALVSDKSPWGVLGARYFAAQILVMLIFSSDTTELATVAWLYHIVASVVIVVFVTLALVFRRLRKLTADSDAHFK